MRMHVIRARVRFRIKLDETDLRLRFAEVIKTNISERSLNVGSRKPSDVRV